MVGPMGDPTRQVTTSDGCGDPAGYPWEPAAAPGVLVQGRFHPTPWVDDVLSRHSAASMPDRHSVVAVGSNASPAVMHRKLTRAGVSTVLPMTMARVARVGVGHSAHVSQPGFIAAAPFRSTGADRTFVITHLDDDQLAAIDATEPNYRRVRVDEVWLYASLWGVLAVDGEPIGLRDQGELHATLAEADPRFGAIVGGRSARAVAAELAHDGTVDHWRRWWRDTGMAKPDGLA